MASLFSRSIHTVKPHIPLIQFPKRFPLETLFSSQPSLAYQKAPGKIVQSKTVESNVTVLEESELPIKYKRAIILPEEIAYVERGGPD